MDRVDLDVAQARVDILPGKYDRRRISEVLAIRRLSSRHYKRPMSEGDVCSGWMLLLVMVWLLHHIPHSKYWQSFKRRHPLLVCFISLPAALCWKIGKKIWKELGLSYALYGIFISLSEDFCEFVSLLVAFYRSKHWKTFMLSDSVCDAMVMLGLYWEVICDLWLFLKGHCLTTKIHVMYIKLNEVRPRRVVRSKVTKKPPVPVVYYEMALCYRTEWVWFKSLVIRPSHSVIRQLLIMSGDVELNPGPLDRGRLISV